MPGSIYDQHVDDTLNAALQAAANKQTKTIAVGAGQVTVPFPFPSPADWRDHWIYFLLIDRFNNPTKPPAGTWNQPYNFRQGGTFKGIEAQLDYIAALGTGAIWLSPVLKNPKPGWEYNYHGYAAQDFMSIDERFGSDGTTATAERELQELVEAAHARGIYIILDIVLNHTARVFDYRYRGQSTIAFSDADVINGPLGSEPSIEWLNGFGLSRRDWTDDPPPPAQQSPDDTVWPSDLQRKTFFRRRGTKITDSVTPGSFAKGDFGEMRQLVVEYDASSPEQAALRNAYGKTPVLHILIRIHQYLVAKFDFDGFRIDTVKYVDPGMVQVFGNAMREFALSIGKKNFFTFGEVYDDEDTIKHFIGRNGNAEGFGIDAALDFPLFFTLPKVAKSVAPVEQVRRVFMKRKEAEKELLSSHGEAGRFFVSFLDNHDQHERFFHPDTPPAQILLGIAIQFCLQGIPCLYYGTEQGLTGTKKGDGSPDLKSLESVREALWGKPAAFDLQQFFFKQVSQLSRIRKSEPALQYGRLYFRELSANKKDFGLPQGVGGVVAFSRILSDREIIIVANTNTTDTFTGFVLADMDIARTKPKRHVQYSNLGTTGTGNLELCTNCQFYEQDNWVGTGDAQVLFVDLKPMEVQILTP